MLPTALSYDDLIRRLALFDISVIRGGKGSEVILGSNRFRDRIHTIKGKEKEPYDIRVINSILRRFEIPKNEFWVDVPVLKKLEKEKRKQEGS
jgi:hypothetical protein